MYRSISIWIFYGTFHVLFCFEIPHNTSQPIVTIPNIGTLLGMTTISRNGRTIYEFRGIRYAQPPTNENRFKSPVKPETSNKNIDATKYGNVCPQPSIETSHFVPKKGLLPLDSDELEDCLFLDVYSPKLGLGANLPVMVYIHGGAFLYGASSSIRPSYLLDHDIILVVPQYRLGPLGFLCLHTDDVPGNAGLLDQILALRWVNDNIAFFGGDNTKVTVAGSSAGAASISILQLSPLTKGLFRGVIALSGAAVSPWAYDKNALTSGLEIASLVGCGSNADCLQDISPSKLINAYLKHSFADRGKPGLGFGGCAPVAQQRGRIKVITKNPLDLLTYTASTGLPLLTGTTKNEGNWPMESFYNYFLVPNNYTNENEAKFNILTMVLQTIMGYNDFASVITNAFQEKYLAKSTLGNFTAMRPGLSDVFGALLFKGPIHNMVKINYRHGGMTYLYSFNYVSSNSKHPFVNHGDELIYLFPCDVSLNEEDKKLSMTFVKFIANFVLYGNPTPNGEKMNGVPKWTEYTDTNTGYMKISNNNMKILTDYTAEYSNLHKN